MMHYETDKTEEKDTRRRLARVVAEQDMSTLRGTGKYSDSSLEGIYCALMDGLEWKTPNNLIYMLQETKGWD